MFTAPVHRHRVKNPMFTAPVHRHRVKYPMFTAPVHRHRVKYPMFTAPVHRKCIILFWAKVPIKQADNQKSAIYTNVLDRPRRLPRRAAGSRRCCCCRRRNCRVFSCNVAVTRGSLRLRCSCGYVSPSAPVSVVATTESFLVTLLLHGVACGFGAAVAMYLYPLLFPSAQLPSLFW